MESDLIKIVPSQPCSKYGHGSRGNTKFCKLKTGYGMPRHERDNKQHNKNNHGDDKDQCFCETYHNLPKGVEL